MARSLELDRVKPTPKKVDKNKVRYRWTRGIDGIDKDADIRHIK